MLRLGNQRIELFILTHKPSVKRFPLATIYVSVAFQRSLVIKYNPGPQTEVETPAER